MRPAVNDHDDNPYASPNAGSQQNHRGSDVKPPLPPKARPMFRILAGGLACLMFSVALFPIMPLSAGTVVFMISMAIFGLQFLFAAITGRWFNLGNVWRRA